MRNSIAWGLAGVLAALVVWGGPLLFVRLKLYWTAKRDGVEAHLAGAPLSGANLRGAALAGANLRGAVLRGADLREANFSSLAYFPGGAAGLERAADLSHTDLRNAKLDHANLIDTDLRSADLRGATLTGAHLSDAHYNALTRWPAGFDPARHGAVKEARAAKTMGSGKPPSALILRMPAVSGEAICPLVVLYYEEDWGLWFRRLGPQVIVAVWADGRIISSRDQWKGGAPYQVGRVAPERVHQFLNDLDRRGIFADPVRLIKRFPPDSPYTTIAIAAGSKRLDMSSNHENGERAILDRPGHAQALAVRPDSNPHFREVWDDLRAAICGLIPEGSREDSKIEFKIRKLPPEPDR
jgi:uncharacterized protein YjbI with pentapeptide repeats